MSEELEITERSRVRLFGNRASYRKTDIYGVIDISLYGVVAYSIGDQPYATPTMIWRQGDFIYWHGSAGSRMLRAVAAGGKISVTFVHVDGMVLSRLASAHTMNYRSVMLFGSAELVEDLGDRKEQLRFFLSRLFPGRWDEVKQPSLHELKSIIMVRMLIREGSLKMRDGPPGDGRLVFGGEELYKQACWAGTLPLATCVRPVKDANRLKDKIGSPRYIASFPSRFSMQISAESRADKIAAEVTSIEAITHAIKLFQLCPRKGRFPPMDAGAHVTVSVTLADKTRDLRHYTIVNASPEGRWCEIAVLRRPDGRGGSLYMHDAIEVGSRLDVQIPKNDFPLVEDATHLVLLAGGIGITPIIAMARELEVSGRSAEVHYSAKGTRSAAFLHELRALKHVRYSFYDTSRGSNHRMRVSDVLGPPNKGRHVYVCGPHSLIEETRLAADRLGYPQGTVHHETFTVFAPQSSDLPIEVEFAKANRKITVTPGRSILDAALAEGFEIDHSCKRGECGLCVTAVLGGRPHHRDHFLETSDKERGDKMCICVSWARSPSLILNL